MSEERIRFLISEFKKGNQGVFDEFFNLTKNQVFYNIFSIVKNAENSEDILQETYVKFLLNLDQIDENSSILGYLMVISRNLSLDFLKKHKKLVVPQDGEVIVSTNDENSIDSNTIIECAKKILKEKEFRIFILHTLNEMTFEEISSEVKRPLGTVIWSYNNAIKKIRKDLKLWKKLMIEK